MKLNIYWPCANFSKLNFVYRKYIDLSELEAIIISFIFANCHKNNPDAFFDTFYKTFNLEKNKWEKFILNILNDLKRNETIFIDNEIKPEITLCSDIKLNDFIYKKIDNNEFKGADSEKIKKNIDIAFPLRNDLYKNKEEYICSNKTKVLDENYDNITKKMFAIAQTNNYEENLIKIAKDKYPDGIFINFELINNPNDNVDLLSDFFISYIDMELNVDYIIDRSILRITSNQKNEYDILKMFLENDSFLLLKNSVQKTIKNIVNNINIESIDDNSELIDIKNYNDYLKKVKNLSNLMKWNNFYFIDCGFIWELKWKKTKLKVLEYDCGDILLLSKIKISKIFDLIKKSLTQDEYRDNIINLVEYLDNKNELNTYLREHENFIMNSKFLKIKKYILKEIFINNKINKEEIIICLKSNNIDVNEWVSIISNNHECFKKINYEVFFKNDIDHHQFNDDLINKKIIILLSQLEINPLEIPSTINSIDNIKKIYDRFESLYKSYKDYNLHNLITEYKQLKKELNNLLNNLYDYNNYNNYIKDKIFKKIINSIETRIEEIKNTNLENLTHNIIKLTHKMDSILQSNKMEKMVKLEESLTNQTLKEQWKKIREFRNMHIHQSKNNTKKIEKLLPEEIEIKNKECKEYLKWLDDNEKNISEDLKKS